MRHTGWPLYGDAPQVHAVDRRHVLVHERRFGHQPEQPRLQARPPAPRCIGTRLQDGLGMPHLVARAYRSIFVGHGALPPRDGQSRMALLLPRGTRERLLRTPRHHPARGGHAARHREMACTRQAFPTCAPNRHGLLRRLFPLYDGTGMAGHTHLRRTDRTFRGRCKGNHMERLAAQREISEARHRMVQASLRPLLGRTTDPAIRDA